MSIFVEYVTDNMKWPHCESACVVQGASLKGKLVPGGAAFLHSTALSVIFFSNCNSCLFLCLFKQGNLVLFNIYHFHWRRPTFSRTICTEPGLICSRSLLLSLLLMLGRTAPRALSSAALSQASCIWAGSSWMCILP